MGAGKGVERNDEAAKLGLELDQEGLVKEEFGFFLEHQKAAEGFLAKT